MGLAYDPPVALYGRDRERERLESLIGTVRSGGSEVLVVRGAAGAGKSALLDHAAAVAAAAGEPAVLRVTAVETESELAFGLLHGLIHPALPLISELPAPQRRALDACFGLDPEAPAPDRLLVSLATLTLLSIHAERGPLLCLIDDLHWADPASAEVLTFVGRRLDSEAIGLIAATRPSEGPSSPPQGIEALPTLDVGPLSPAAAERVLAGGRRRAIAAPALKRILAETGGNALAIAELGAMLGDRELDGSRPLPDPLPVGTRVERAYAGQLAALPDDCRTALLIAAAQGGGEVATALGAAVDLGVGEPQFDELERRGLIRTAGGRIAFRHPLLRSAAYSAAPGGERRAAHRALAAALGSDPERRVWQLAAAAVGPDPDVAAELTALAEGAAARGAHAAAAAALERAAELEPDPERRAGKLAAAAEHAWTAGRADEGRRLIDRGRETGPSADCAATLHRLQGRIDAWGGDPASGISMLCREAAAIASERPELALELLAEAAEVASFTADAALAEQVGATAEQVPAQAAGGDATTGKERVALLLRRLLAGTHELARGHFAEAGPLLAEAVALGRDSDDPVTLNLAGRAAVYLGDEGTCFALDSRAAELARERGALFTLPSIVVRLAITELRMGRLRAAASSAAEAAELSELSGQQDLIACAQAALAQVLAERGDEDGCRAAAQRALAISEPRGLGLFSDFARAALGHLDLAQGRNEEALQRLTALQHPAIAMPAALDQVEAGLGAGEPEAAASAARGAAQWAAATGVPVARAVALTAEAAVAPPERGEELLHQALELHGELERPFERARAQLRLGELLRRRRQRSEARAELRAALDFFESAGAEPWAERARAELRASGQTARRRDPSTIDDLTPQELRIGSLVASGLTNKEIAARLFLSPRTVDFHLRNLFRKLGVKSRTELARFDVLRDAAD